MTFTSEQRVGLHTFGAQCAKHQLATGGVCVIDHIHPAPATKGRKGTQAPQRVKYVVAHRCPILGSGKAATSRPGCQLFLRRFPGQDLVEDFDCGLSAGCRGHAPASWRCITVIRQRSCF